MYSTVIINKIVVLISFFTFLSCGNDNEPSFIPRPEGDVIVDVNRIIADDVRTKVGINLNAGIDNDLNREPGAIPLRDALGDMGAKHLRYPGGNKSNYYSWAAAPFTDPSTNFWGGWYANAAQNTINFDEFMDICISTGAQPHINVAYNPDLGLNEELAAAWVEYANITKGYNIKYWEIGNELWKSELGFTTESLAETVKAYSEAMKAVDPSIKIAVSWRDIQGIINACGDDLDYVTISDYTGNLFHSYDSYANRDNVKMTNLYTGSSKKIIISEFAPILFDGQQGATGDWAVDNPNDTGRGILTFDQIGQLISSNNCEYACFWNTRWYDEGESLSDAFDDYNNTRPTSLALSIWGNYLLDNMVSTTSKIGSIVSYASVDNSTGDLNIFLINKKEESQVIDLGISSDTGYNSSAEVWQYKGNSNTDKNTNWGRVVTTAVNDNLIQELNLPSTSITVLTLK
jgi:alpha-L-arabinofuranosidase